MGQCQPAVAALGWVLHPWGTSIPAVAGPVPAPAWLSPLLQSPEQPGEAAEGTCRSWCCDSSSAPYWGRGISEHRWTNRLCSWGTAVCLEGWRAPCCRSSSDPGTIGDQREQGLLRGCPGPSCCLSCSCQCQVWAGVQRGRCREGGWAAVAQPWGPMFASAGECPGAGRWGRCW